MNRKQHKVSWPQRKLLTARALYPGDPANNLVQLWRVDGHLDADRATVAFETCLDQMVASTVHFEAVDDDYVQVLDPDRRVRCRREVFDPGESDAAQARAMADAYEWVRDPIDPGTWPLVRITLYCTGDDVRWVLFAMPHIICDAYSAYTLLDAIAERYNGGDNAAPLAPNELFGDYVTGIETDAPEVVANPEAVEFFRRHLANVTTLSHGAISQPRDPRGRLAGRFLAVTVAGTPATRIRAGLKARRISEHAFFFAVYCVLLGRLTREPTVVVGLPVATRDDRRDVGYHVNTLPLTVNLPEDKPFHELCQDLQALTYEVLRFRKFDYFHRGAAPLRGYMNNAFTFQKAPITIPFDGCHLAPVPLDSGYVPFDFDLVVENLNADGFRCKFHLSTWFDTIDVEELFTTVVTALADDPELPLGEVALASEASLRQFYAELNKYRPVAQPQALPYLFAAAATRWSDRAALTHGARTVSYGELDRDSDRIAAVLVDRYPDVSKVAIWMPRGVTPIACLLGILKAGKAYVPIDPDSPVARLRLILAELGECLVLCDEAREPTLAAQGLRILTTRELASASATPEPFVPPPISIDDHAYLIYTSGSTGVPKGVTITHRNAVNFLTRLQDEHVYLTSDVWTQCGSLAFDISVWEIFGCLLSGGRLVLVSSEQVRTPEAFYRLVQDEQVTVLALTPTAFSGFRREDDLRREPLSLRRVFVGGEPFQATQLTSWLDRHPLAQIPIYNCYGITETTVLTTSHRLGEDDILRPGLGIIGRPWAHAGVHVVDGYLRPLPPGVPGELVIHGDSVSPGYFKRDELTAKRFVEIDLLGERLRVYRSGDLVRVTRDLELEFMGRADQQVQLHGFRVELGEIASAIGPLIAPGTCHVCMIERSAGVEQLAAFIVGTQTHEELAALRVDLKRALPSYMVPDYLVTVPAMPVTVNGKVDVPALLAYLPRADDGRAGDAVGATEKVIQSLVAAAIHHNDFSREENFFDIGLNSVQVADVYQGLVRQFPGTRLRMTDMFRYTSVASLAEHIDDPGGADAPATGDGQGLARRRTLLRTRGGRS
jgi:amino acid adenylation domain-containing protein